MPEPPDHALPAADEADLAALADDRLDARRRDELLARVAAEPALRAALERQRVAVAAIAAAVDEVSAPLRLRAAVDELARPAPAMPARRPWLRGARLLLPVAAALLALAIVLAPDPATVDAVLAVAERPPLAAAALGPAPGPLLGERVDGVRFPNYRERFGWEPAGVRADTVSGRATRTVRYRRAGRVIAYTIVAGDALAEPDASRAATRDGVALRTFARDGRRAVSWQREGRTCVLSGRDVATATLLELASWKGKGAVRF